MQNIDENDPKELNTDDDFEIEVVSDEAPESPKVEPPSAEAKPVEKTAASATDSGGDADDDEDDSDYGEKVRKRIAKETWKRREAERQAQAAKQQLEQIQAQLQSTQQRVVTADDSAIQAHERAVDAEYERVQTAYKRAYDEGDTDAMFKATEELADLRLRKRQIDGWKQQRQQRPAQPQQPQRPVQQQADPRAMDWATRNTWFGKDPIKTGAAYALDAELKSRGVDPRSDAYYEELDRRLGEAFPDIRGAKPKAERATPSQPVAGVTSRTTGEKRKVTLTASEAAMAESLGVPLIEYARYLKRA